MKGLLLYASVLSIALVACGSDDARPCDPVARTGCDSGLVCEAVTDGEPTCFAPVQLIGHVRDLGGTNGVAGARVVAVDGNGVAVSDVVTSGADGAFTLPVPVERAADGTPSARAVSLRADAAGYQSFPGGVRRALPLDLATSTRSGEGPWVISSALTELGLLPIVGAPPGGITGKVEVPADRAGILIVAEAGGKGYPAIADSSGDYAIYNLPAGTYRVTAYAKGHVYAPAEVPVASALATGNLRLSADLPATVTGTVSVVNAPGGSATSVVLFVESTFDATTEHGIGPPGLRAPDSGPPTIGGAFRIEGVPPGRYVVLAAYENDDLVRDPDQCQSGTAVVHIAVAAGSETAVSQTFKVTEALPVLGPGVDSAEQVTASPTLRFANDSSASSYDLEVFDAFGARVWSTTVADNQAPLAVAYAGPALAAGMYYQFRATSYRMRSGMRCAISRTEQLRGVFFKP